MLCNTFPFSVPGCHRALPVGTRSEMFREEPRNENSVFCWKLQWVEVVLWLRFSAHKALPGTGCSLCLPNIFLSSGLTAVGFISLQSKGAGTPLDELAHVPLHFWAHTSRGQTEPQFPLKLNLRRNRQPPNLTSAWPHCNHRWQPAPSLRCYEPLVEILFYFRLYSVYFGTIAINTGLHVRSMNHWQTVSVWKGSRKNLSILKKKKEKGLFWWKSLNNLTWNVSWGLSKSLIFHLNVPVFSCGSGAAKKLSKAPFTQPLGGMETVCGATLTSYGKQRMYN